MMSEDINCCSDLPVPPVERAVCQPQFGRNASGQAMVEFALMLTIFMILGLGMLYTTRLLTFDYWAQQEARFVAFEQTWAPRSAAGTPYGDPLNRLTDREYFRRPKVFDLLSPENSGFDNGSLTTLMALLHLGDDQEKSIDRTEPSEVLLASASRDIWSEKTLDWLSRQRGRFSLTPVAFAAQSNRGKNLSTGDQFPKPPPPRNQRQRLTLDVVRDDYEQGFVGLVSRGGFGPRFCSEMANLLSSHGYSKETALFSEKGCGTRYDTRFGVFVSRNLDLPQLFRDYGYQLAGGFEPPDALQTTVERAVASQFYSFFDTTIANSFGDASGEINSAVFDIAQESISSAQFQRLLTEMRYMGSIIAVGIIEANIGIVSGHVVSGERNAEQEKAFEDAVNSVLHSDAGELGSYLLPVTYLPIPSTLKPAFGPMYDGLMKNVLDNDVGLWDDLVENSNRFVSISYPASAGISLPIRNRWQTEDKKLTSRFYLVTEPWHITRRESAFGPYRQKGDELDSNDDSSEEGILRRRVAGLFLIPSRSGEFIASISEVVPAIGGVASVLEGVDWLISTVKSFIIDNPLQDFAVMLQELSPFDVDFTLPRFPSVRPDAYPGTEEISGDRLTDEERNFQDYIDEQKSNNPSAKPEFHDD